MLTRRQTLEALIAGATVAAAQAVAATEPLHVGAIAGGPTIAPDSPNSSLAGPKGNVRSMS
jgi:hypothetical protein